MLTNPKVVAAAAGISLAGASIGGMTGCEVKTSPDQILTEEVRISHLTDCNRGVYTLIPERWPNVRFLFSPDIQTEEGVALAKQLDATRDSLRSYESKLPQFLYVEMTYHTKAFSYSEYGFPQHRVDSLRITDQPGK